MSDVTGLGETLKQRRTALGRTIEQMSANTRIHVRILKALEENRYADLPARAFTRGFIVSYAKALGMNADDFIKTHHDYLEERFTERSERDQGHQGYVFEGKEIEQNRRWLLLGTSAAAIFALVVLFFFKPQNHKRKESHKQFSKSEQPENTGATGLPEFTVTPAPTVVAAVTPIVAPTVSATPVATPKPTASPTATPVATATPATDPLNKGDHLDVKVVKRRILIEAKGDVWVRYQSDDAKPSILLLRKGRFLVVKGKTKVLIEASDPSMIYYKTRGVGYQPAPAHPFEVVDAGALAPLDGGVAGAPTFPTSIPKSASENR